MRNVWLSSWQSAIIGNEMASLFSAHIVKAGVLRFWRNKGGFDQNENANNNDGNPLTFRNEVAFTSGINIA